MTNDRDNNLENYGHVGLLHPSDYLSGPDLRGHDVVVTIEKIEPRAELTGKNNQRDYKPVVHLKGKRKKWVLNKTNATTIAGIHGRDPRKWIGKSVTIHSQEVFAFGSMHDAIRVRPEAPQPKRAPNKLQQQMQTEPAPEIPTADPADVEGPIERGELADIDHDKHNYGPPPMGEDPEYDDEHNEDPKTGEVTE